MRPVRRNYNIAEPIPGVDTRFVSKAASLEVVAGGTDRAIAEGGALAPAAAP